MPFIRRVRTADLRRRTSEAPRASALGWYDGAIMMAKTQITLETEMQRRANELGVSLA